MSRAKCRWLMKHDGVAHVRHETRDTASKSRVPGVKLPSGTELTERKNTVLSRDSVLLLRFLPELTQEAVNDVRFR
jgi:hypothetical protein